MPRRLTQSRLERLERTITPRRIGPPPCLGCGAPDTEVAGILFDEPENACTVCGRTLNKQGQPLIVPYMRIVLAEESDFPS